jgi:hypothetical protein
MDRATTTAKGVPDFIIATHLGMTLWVEAKARQKKPTIEQCETASWLRRYGHYYALVYCIEEFKQFVEKILANHE